MTDWLVLMKVAYISEVTVHREKEIGSKPQKFHFTSGFTSEDFQGSAEKMVFQQWLCLSILSGRDGKFWENLLCSGKNYWSETQTTCWMVVGMFLMQHSPLLVNIVLIGDPWSPESRQYILKSKAATRTLKDTERQGQGFHLWRGPSNQHHSLYNFFIKELANFDSCCWNLCPSGPSLVSNMPLLCCFTDYPCFYKGNVSANAHI